MIKFLSVRSHQRVTSLLSAMILTAMLILSLACKTNGKQQGINKVKAEFEATYAEYLESTHPTY